MTSNDFCMELKVYILRNYGSQKEAAKSWGVSGAYISTVCRGAKRPNKRILECMGLVRNVSVTYTQA